MAPRLWIASFILLLAAGTGCKKPSGTAAVTVDTTAVRAQVDSTLRRHFTAFESGDMATWGGIFGPEVFFTAADPAQVYSGRDTLLTSMESSLRPSLEAGISIALRPMSDVIWVEADGRTAAATYELDYTVSYEKQVFPYRLRAAYLLERDTAGWRALASQYSRPITYDSLFMSLLSHKIPGVAPVGGQVPSSVGEVVQQFRADIRDISKASITPTAAVVTPGGLVHGPEQARAELAQWLGPVGNATEPGDGIRAGLNPAGTVGWVATNLYVPVFAGPESAIAPMRALFVYHLAQDRWEIVQASLSVGLRER
jgi:hypothetical protein